MNWTDADTARIRELRDHTKTGTLTAAEQRELRELRRREIIEAQRIRVELYRGKR